MTSTPLAYAEKRMQQRWYDLVMAEQSGASAQALERLYNAYIRAVDEYNSRLAVVQSQEGQAESAFAPESQSVSSTSEMYGGKRKKKAS